jgi:hypothetical protein
MRRGPWLAALVIGLGLAAQGRAQKTPATFFGGANPRDIKYQPIDPSHSVVPVAQPKQDKFSFRHLFSKVIPGLSPAPSNNQTTIAPPFPTSPGTSPLQPMMPVAPRR